VFVVDRVHKWAMLGPFDIGGKGAVEVAPFFDLVLVWNRGVSYGLFQQDSDAGRLILVVVNVIASLALWAWLARVHRGLTAVSIGLVIGGAVGNAVDRA